jgi:hypothetical protein
VIAFYAAKVGTPRAPGTESERARASSVSIQDDSEGRPVKLRVIVVNRAESATTLVISRADGENETHITWLRSVRFDGNP